MQAEVRGNSRLCIFSDDGALMSDDLWADQGGQRRKRRLRKGKERKDGTEGRYCGCLRMSLYTIIVLPLTILLPSWRKRQQVRYPSEDHIFYPGQHMLFTWIHSTHAMPSLLSVLAAGIIDLLQCRPLPWHSRLPATAQFTWPNFSSSFSSHYYLLFL